jgi:hypothetical protein
MIRLERADCRPAIGVRFDRAFGAVGIGKLVSAFAGITVPRTDEEYYQSDPLSGPDSDVRFSLQNRTPYGLPSPVAGHVKFVGRRNAEGNEQGAIGVLGA